MFLLTGQVVTKNVIKFFKKLSCCSPSMKHRC